MGFRRFSPESARFLTPDFYGGATANLGLSTDPINGNRYAFGSANPISYIEQDGHGATNSSGEMDGGMNAAPLPKSTGGGSGGFTNTYSGVDASDGWARSQDPEPHIPRHTISGGGSGWVTPAPPPNPSEDEVVDGWVWAMRGLDFGDQLVGLVEEGGSQAPAAGRTINALKGLLKYVDQVPVSVLRRLSGPGGLGIGYAANKMDGQSDAEAGARSLAGAGGGITGFRAGVQGCPRSHPVLYGGCVFASMVTGGAIAEHGIGIIFESEGPACSDGWCVYPGLPPLYLQDRKRFGTV